MLTSYIIELLTSTDVAHSKLNILRQIPIVEPLLQLDITSIESRLVLTFSIPHVTSSRESRLEIATILFFGTFLIELRRHAG